MIEVEADLHLLVVEVEDVAAVPEAIRDRDLRLTEEGMEDDDALLPEEGAGDAPEASVVLVVDLPHLA